MQVNPFIDFCYHFCRSLTVYNSIYNTYGAFVFTISEMYMRRIVVTPKQRDNYTIKTTNFRHCFDSFII